MTEPNTKAFSGSFSADLDFHLGANEQTNQLKTNVEIGYDKYKINQHKQVVSLFVRKRENEPDNQGKEPTPFLALATATDISAPDKPTQNFYAHVKYPEKIQAGDQVTISNIQLSITYADETFVNDVNKMIDIDPTKQKVALANNQSQVAPAPKAGDQPATPTTQSSQ